MKCKYYGRLKDFFKSRVNMISMFMLNFYYIQERNLLLDELLKHRGDKQIEQINMESDRVQLSLLEEKIKEVLHMLRSLNSMVRTLKIWF